MKNGGAVDQGGQTGSQDAQAQLPSVPVQRGAALAERARVQPGKPVAAVGAAEEDRELSLTSLQRRLVKTVGRLIKHSRHYWLMLAESHLTRRLFGSMAEKTGLSGQVDNPALQGRRRLPGKLQLPMQLPGSKAGCLVYTE